MAVGGAAYLVAKAIKTAQGRRLRRPRHGSDLRVRRQGHAGDGGGRRQRHQRARHRAARNGRPASARSRSSLPDLQGPHDRPHPAIPARRRTRRHRLLRRARHQRRGALDARQGRDPLRLHRQPRPARRERLRRHPAQGQGLRRRDRAPGRLPAAAGGRRHRRDPVRRVPHQHRRRHLLQHHAARPRRHRHRAGGGDARRRRQHLGRRQHLQGQRHRALLPLRPARQPDTAHLQALARPALHRRTGRPQGDERVPHRPRLRLQDERREGLLDRPQHARRHARGQGPGVPEQAASRSSTRSWAWRSGATTWR